MPEKDSVAKQLKLGLSIAVAVVTLGVAAFAVHASNPHKGAVHRHEFEQVQKTVDKIDSKVDRILERLSE